MLTRWFRLVGFCEAADDILKTHQGSLRKVWEGLPFHQKERIAANLSPSLHGHLMRASRRVDVNSIVVEARDKARLEARKKQNEVVIREVPFDKIERLIVLNIRKRTGEL